MRTPSTYPSKHLVWGSLVGPQGTPKFQWKELYKIFWLSSVSVLFFNKTYILLESYDFTGKLWPKTHRYGPPWWAIRAPKVLVGMQKQAKTRPIYLGPKIFLKIWKALKITSRKADQKCLFLPPGGGGEIYD